MAYRTGLQSATHVYGSSFKPRKPRWAAKKRAVVSATENSHACFISSWKIKQKLLMVVVVVIIALKGTGKVNEKRLAAKQKLEEKQKES